MKRSEDGPREQDLGEERHARRRSEWVEANAPQLGDGQPFHTIHVSAFQGDFELEELDDEGNVCGARLSGDRGSIFGTTEEVVAASTELSTEDPWVVEVGLALSRERKWKSWGSGWGRRHFLEIRLAQGQMFHVSASANRESILRHGLDWRHMGQAAGVAGSATPELPGIFVQESADDDFFVRMAKFPTDMWSVLLEGRWIETGPSGWWFVARPVEPERLRLLSPEDRAEDD